MSKIRQRRIRQLRRWLRKDLRVGRKKSKFLRRGRRPWNNWLDFYRVCRYFSRRALFPQQSFLRGSLSRMHDLRFLTLGQRASRASSRQVSLLRYFVQKPRYHVLVSFFRRRRKRRRRGFFVPYKFRRDHVYRRRSRKFRSVRRRAKFRKAWIRRFVQTFETTPVTALGTHLSARHPNFQRFFRSRAKAVRRQTPLKTRKLKYWRRHFRIIRWREPRISQAVVRLVRGTRTNELPPVQLIKPLVSWNLNQPLRRFRRFSGAQRRVTGLSRGFRRTLQGVGRFVRVKSRLTTRLRAIARPSTLVDGGIDVRTFGASIEWSPAASVGVITTALETYFTSIKLLTSTTVGSTTFPLYVQDLKLPPVLAWWCNRSDMSFTSVTGWEWAMFRSQVSQHYLNDSVSFSSQLFCANRSGAWNLHVPHRAARGGVGVQGFVSKWFGSRLPHDGTSGYRLEVKTLLRLALRTSYYRQIIRLLRTQKRTNAFGYINLQFKWGTLNLYNINFLRFMQGGLLRVKLGDSARSLHIGYEGGSRLWGSPFSSFRAFAERRVLYEGENGLAHDYYLGIHTHKFYSAAYFPFVGMAQSFLVTGEERQGDIIHETGVQSPDVGWSVPTRVGDHWGLGRTLVLSDLRYIYSLFDNPVLLKYFLWTRRDPNQSLQSTVRANLFLPALYDVQRYNFSSRVQLFQTSNLWPVSTFSYVIRRRLLKTFTNRQFSPEMTMWVYYNLVRFMEHYSGRKVYLQFNPFVENSLTFHDLSRCYLWESRLRTFQRLLGAKIFVGESLRILYLALKSHDPKFLGNWIKEMLYRLSFWKSRLLFRYLKYVMKHFYYPCSEEIGFRGLKLTLRGKISVAGNARTRTLFYAIGDTSNAKMNNRVLSYFTTVNSFTGVMGFTLLFYF